jgi:hypothetical protein
MRRILAAGVFLLMLVTALGGCQDRRKDEFPTQRLDPKEQPQPVGKPEPF